MATNDDSDWEYEYDEQETEDYFLTLDLTTHVPPNHAHDKKPKAPKTGRGSNKSLANAPGTTQPATDQASGPALGQPPDPAPGPAASQEDHASSQLQQDPPPPDRIQIVDLHGENPLVSYNNALYSCRWATDVGTSLFFTPPLAHIHPDHMPMRSTPSFDLLGAASARLLAVPATMKPRNAPPSSTSPRQAFSDQHTFATYHGDVVHQNETEGMHIELPSTASASRVSQARFLERLSAIKARRGNRDHVPVTNIKIYKPPEGWEAERDAWIAKETSMSDKNRLEAEIRAAKISRRSKKALVELDDMPSPQQQQRAYDDDDDAALSAGQTPQPGADDQSDQDLDAPDPSRIVLASQIPRKRKTRGGPRGGAPSGKKLRQSLGLPEARRDKRAVGRPRQIRLDSELTEGVDEAGPASASSHQGSAEPGATVSPPGTGADQDQL